jgi:hypothetical protein
MSVTSNVPARIKVICEACINNYSADCVLCSGSRYYFWDPSSCLCYSGDGQLIQIQDENGDALSVIRKHRYDEERQPDFNTMINFIELWVSETPKRKWRLTFDESGWQGCIWFNRFKKICFETSDMNIEKCVYKTYLEILKYTSK